MEAGHNALSDLLYGGMRNAMEISENHLLPSRRLYLQVKQLIKNILATVILLLIEAVLIINVVGPMASMVISLMRLIQHDYDGSDAANKGKLRAALFIFYSLALVHSVCFYCWVMLQRSLSKRLKLLATQSGLEKHQWGHRLLRKYLRDTKAKCANDLMLPGGWNLITYAVGLLESVSRDDLLDGVRMLDVFVVEKTLPIRVELLSSKNSIQNLIIMLEFTSPDLKDQEIREHATRIVADVAGELRVGVAQMPAGAMQCISSLMEPSPQRQWYQEQQEKEQEWSHQQQQEGEDEEALGSSAGSEQGSHQSSHITNDQDARGKRRLIGFIMRFQPLIAERRYRDMEMKKEKRERMIEDESFKPKGTRELIHQGLQILERLSRDKNNCREICNSQGLLPKIIAPITCSSFLDTEYDSAWIDILSILLRLVRRLTSAPGESGRRLCHEIWTTKDAVRNLLGILDGQIKCSLQLQGNAMEILTEVAIRIPSVMTENLVKKLCHIFLPNSGMIGLRIKAGEALVKLLSTQGTSGQVPMMEVFDMLVEDKECQISAAAILELFCCRSPKQAGHNKSLVEINDELFEERKYLAAMLSLLVVICEKMVDAGVVPQVTSVRRL